MTAGEGVAVLSILTVFATGIGGFISLSEAKTKTQETVTEHGQRIGRLELDNAAHARENALEMSIQRLEFKIQQLTDQVQRLEARRR